MPSYTLDVFSFVGGIVFGIILVFAFSSIVLYRRDG
jgi:hypothetical protein